MTHSLSLLSATALPVLLLLFSSSHSHFLIVSDEHNRINNNDFLQTSEEQLHQDASNTDIRGQEKLNEISDPNASFKEINKGDVVSSNASDIDFDNTLNKFGRDIDKFFKKIGNNVEKELDKMKAEVEGAFIGPHWQPRHVHLAYGNSSSEVVVTWSTETYSADSKVEWGTDMFLLNDTSIGSSHLFVDGGILLARQWIHRVHLTELSPDTAYYYHVGGQFGWSAVFGFKTVQSGTEGWPLRLVIFGDMGVVNAHSLVRLQQEAHQGMYDAVIHVGDMAYDMDTNDGEIGDIFMDQIEPIAAYLPYMTCPGNHENAYDFSHYRNRFSMPNYQETESIYYSFNLGPVHFISISTELYYFGPNQDYRLGKQYQWLVDDLNAATTAYARAERPWIIIFGHRPMYCSTGDVDDCTRPTTLTRVGLPITHKFALEPLLAKYGVDLVVWAHEHVYERLWPLYNFTVMNGTEAPYTNPRAPVHIITGSAGCSERIDPFIMPKPEWSAHRVADYGYTRMTVLNHTHLHFEQVSDDQDGNLTDSVMLVREHHESYVQYLPEFFS